MVRKKNSAHSAYTSGPQRGGSASITTRGNPHIRGYRNPTASHLSLAEEARTTERHHSWHSDLKLRHTQVNFVSAGSLEDTANHGVLRRVSQAAVLTTGDVTPDSEQSLAGMIVDQEDLCNHDLCHVERGKESGVFSNHNCPPSGTTISTVTVHRVNDIFNTDIKGSTQHVEIGMPPPTIRRSLSPVPSNSSAEVVVFRGRNQSRQGRGASFLHKMGRLQKRRPINADLGFENVSDSTNQHVGKFQIPRPKSSLAERKDVGSIERAGGTTFKANLSMDSHIRPRSRRVGGSRKKEQDEVMEDYIQNMQINLEENCNRPESKLFGLKDPRVSDDDIWQAETEASLMKEAISNSKPGWTDEDLDGFEDLSTSSNIPKTIVGILSKRQKPSGVQYLAVWAGHDSDDARWAPSSSLEKNGAPELISIFDNNKKEPANTSAVGSGSDNEALRILNLDDETEDTSSEDDLVEGKKARITDEQTALRLAKQEQLGFGSSEVMLFAGDELEGWSDEEDNNRLLQATRKYSKPKTLTRKRNGNAVASARSFTDARIQDPYGGFDVMDQERPSLRRRTKGRRGVLPLKLSDSELEASVLLAWENDRTKKKLRKQERETLRAFGLLNRKNKLDMKAKFREGMSTISFKEVIRDFLDSEETSVSFPPMDKKDRMRVHEFANAFNLKSRSVGGGRSRYPSLYKTSRTLPYNDNVFDSIESRLNRPRFLSRKDPGVKRAGAARPLGAGRGGGGVAAAVSYRDGEIVGAAAPELGTDNKGRAMLEKMGWSTGTALGALNNKGIMQPVVHIVKTTKAGLG